MIPLSSDTEVLALVRHIAQYKMAGAEPDDRSRELVHQCASCARRAGARAEQLVVAIREAWRAEPCGQEYMPEGYDRSLTALLDSVLNAYYAGRRELANSDLSVRMTEDSTCDASERL
jgi:hypothetical protein